jgi:ribosomal protein S18 acetylase RimI-like enzyme
MTLTIKRLSTETLDEFLEYFDHRAFLNDEDWAGCYCQLYLAPPGTPEEDVFGPGKARAGACDKVVSGKMDGYLGYKEGRIVGWCAAGSSMLYPALPDAEDTLARVLCFNIDPDHRQQGVAGELLDLILQDLNDRGFAAVEAAPSIEPASARSFQGTVPMFTERGFEKVTEMNQSQVLMRRYLD